MSEFKLLLCYSQVPGPEGEDLYFLSFISLICKVGRLSTHLPGLNKGSGDGRVLRAVILYEEGAQLMHLFL